MGINDLLKQAQDMGLKLPLGAAGLAALAAGAVAFWRKRGKAARSLPAAVSAVAARISPKEDGAAALRRAWERFRKRLPRDYRRSLTRFDHYLLLGGSSAGHVRLLVRHGNGLEFMRQLLGDENLDPVLPVALTPGALALSLPAQVLEDESGAGREAFRQLAKRVYRSVHPTAVVVVDAGWLKDASYDATADFVRTVRDKLSLLTKLRRRSVEVRMALAGLDALPGAAQALRLCQSEGISLYIPPGERASSNVASASAASASAASASAASASAASASAASASAASASAASASAASASAASDWLAELAAQVPRALVKLGVDDFRSYVSFCRDAPDLMTKVDKLLRALFVPEGAGALLKPAGVFVSSDAVTSPGPFAGRGGHHGLDPLRLHRWRAALAAAAFCTAFWAMYRVHHAEWEKAATALRDLAPTLTSVDRRDEAGLRLNITTFTQRKGEWWVRYMPDLFFGGERKSLREAFSSSIRTNLLIPGLQLAWDRKLTDPGTKMTLHWRRAVFYLALIHSDNRDVLNLRRRMDLVTRMTQLPEGILRDYLDNTDAPELKSFASRLRPSTGDVRDSIGPWRDMVQSVGLALSDGLISSKELETLSDRAEELDKDLPRFLDDKATVGLLEALKDACPLAEHQDCQRRMMDYRRVVLPKSRQEQDGVQFEKVGPLQRLLMLVEGTRKATVPSTHYLSELIGQLSLLGSTARTGQVIRVRLDDSEMTLSEDEWNTGVRRGLADEMVTAFHPDDNAPEDMFFGPDDRARLLRVTWDGGVAFAGSAVLDPSYTRVAYEECVRPRLESLRALMAKLDLPDKAKARLLALVRSATEQYAARYRSEVNEFAKSFATRSTARDILELVLSELAAERSAFERFVQLVDDNTSLGPAATTPSAGAKDAKTEAAAPDAGPKNVQAKNTNPAETMDELVTPFLKISDDYAPWRSAHQDLGTFRGYAREALEALSTQGKVAAKEGAAQGGDRAVAKLLTELSPLGVEGVAELRGSATSFGHKAREWAKHAQLPPAQARPFLEAFESLDHMGEQEVGEVVRRAWERIRPVVAEAASKFPFDRTARQGITPDDLSALFEPKAGLVPEFVRGYLEPLSSVAAGSGGPSASVRQRLHIDEEVAQAVRASAELGQRLWDDKGPRKIALHFKPEPFEALGDAELVPTALTLQLGPRSVRYFNQMPAPTAAEVDWSVDEAAQLRIEYVNTRNRDATGETVLLGDAPYWRALRVLVRASISKPGGLRPTLRYEWIVPVTTPKGTRRLAVRLLLQGDPWAGFTLPNLAVSGESWQ
jgi:hypothetical protein